jgi:lipoate-protein ligase B
MTGFEILSLPGIRKFTEVHQLMLNLVERRARGEIVDTFIFCEHEPVITRGRGLQWTANRSDRSMPPPMVPPGTDYVEIERGGDLTWHGPGQIVVYPVIALGGTGDVGAYLGRDIEKYVRFLEEWWIRVLAREGLVAHRDPAGSGVWDRNRKLASVGVAVRKWITYHGVAMNVVNPLTPFRDFSPCGFGGEVMTRIADLGGVAPELMGPDWRSHWESRLIRELQGWGGTNGPLQT